MHSNSNLLSGVFQKTANNGLVAEPEPSAINAGKSEGTSRRVQSGIYASDTPKRRRRTLGSYSI